MTNTDNRYEEYIELLKANKNLILTGAPGTGKTYLAKKIAEIMEADYEFVQFHPSYDYTDFVEGLRPTSPDGNGNIGFERKDGVFKAFCKRCISPYIKNTVEIKEPRESYVSEQISSEKNVSIQYDNSTSFYDLYKELKHRIQNHTVTLYTVYPRTKMDVRVFGYDIMYNKGGTLNYINADYVQKIFNYYRDKGIYDVSKSRFNDFSSIIGNTLNYTYYRGIVQELLNMCRKVKSNADDYGDKIADLVHSNKICTAGHNYEKDKVDKYPSECNYVFIIDEINRGELSKIFGELFFSIDPGYRGKKGLVKTQYQNLITDKSDPFYDGFYVPENVYIIGTMNDIDRSVESMDFAMRRRFAWKEVRADENTGMLDDLGSMKLDVVAEMNRLNEAIWNDATNDGIEGLSRAYHIGGAYFRKLKLYLNDDFSNKDEAYRKLWDNHLRGVLFEYFRGSIDAAENMKMLENVYFSE